MVKEKKQVKHWNKSQHWPRLMDCAAKATRLTDEEKNRFSRSLAAEVVAATAFLSGCPDPDRIAVAHLTTLIAGFRCPEVFGHRNGESLANRLLTGNYYPGGDPDVIRAGMLILELISLNDHCRDFERDLIDGKANPLAINLNYDQAKEALETEYAGLNPGIREAFKELYRKQIICGNWL